MTGTTALSHGNYTGLAEDYARHRPSYAPSVVAAVAALVGKPVGEIDAVDIGAGTGIFTRMVAALGCRSVTAVEPNDAMRAQGIGGQGIGGTGGFAIAWRAGSGEATGLGDGCCDLLTAASCFHWMDYGRATAEICRLLRTGGRFVALWNPRMIELNPLLVEIENDLKSLQPEMKRVSSGRSGLTERLNDLLWATAGFDDVIYLEGRHRARQTPAQYLGAWRSVNDPQVQLGPARWQDFLGRVERRIAGLDAIETTYLTRAWAARRVGPP